MNGRLVQSSHIADQTLSFVVELEEPLGFRAGQSCDVIINAPIYEDEKGAMRTFTIASSPSDDPRLMFATRETGSAFKRCIAEAPAGLGVEVDGPWGDFVLHDDPGRPAVFLAGGIGITPFRSMIADAIGRGLPHQMTLLYSSRTAASAAFLDELIAWERSTPNLRVVATMTGDRAGWTGRIGAIDAALVMEQDRRDSRPVYYAAGTDAFVQAVRGMLKAMQVADADIRTDEFSGYP